MAKQDRTRAERERARIYAGRLRFHSDQELRRRRDNLMASVFGGILIVALAVGQYAFHVDADGASDASASPSPSATTPAAPILIPTP
ncbi:hypothetical protein FHX49_002605 [Microbacterium endophyticum]|uniref:Dioxygenase n=1 Tax=Microbacterium endophyticum TaxID=1526412 RepID=A0A7W4V6A6_9MICO|nr:dioxygenase [Microbacterium endophyticum]MBB2977013.1 hypothetical protein [Microbacterium endophyticum]NIK36701.1 hypothetical protein [Microbacterium endophyticum]